MGVPAALLVALLVPGFGGAWEEPGWRGFALGRLEARFGPTAAPLVLGIIIVVWHLPLFATGQILPSDVLSILAASLVIAAVFHLGRDGVLVAMLLHATNNAVGGAFAGHLVTGDDAVRLRLARRSRLVRRRRRRPGRARPRTGDRTRRGSARRREPGGRALPDALLGTGGDRLELGRGRLLPGAQAESAGQWIGHVRARYEECLDALGAERIGVRGELRHADPDGTEWIYQVSLFGEDSAGWTSPTPSTRSTRPSPGGARSVAGRRCVPSSC